MAVVQMLVILSFGFAYTTAHLPDLLGLLPRVKGGLSFGNGQLMQVGGGMTIGGQPQPVGVNVQPPGVGYGGASYYGRAGGTYGPAPYPVVPHREAYGSKAYGKEYGAGSYGEGGAYKEGYQNGGHYGAENYDQGSAHGAEYQGRAFGTGYQGGKFGAGSQGGAFGAGYNEGGKYHASGNFGGDGAGHHDGYQPYKPKDTVIKTQEPVAQESDDKNKEFGIDKSDQFGRPNKYEDTYEKYPEILPQPAIQFGVDGETNPAIQFGVDGGTNPAIQFGVDGETNPAIQFGVDGETNPAIQFGVDGGTNPAIQFGVDGETNPAIQFGVDGETNPAIHFSADAQNKPLYPQTNYGNTAGQSSSNYNQNSMYQNQGSEDSWNSNIQATTPSWDQDVKDTATTWEQKTKDKVPKIDNLPFTIKPINQKYPTYPPTGQPFGVDNTGKGNQQYYNKRSTAGNLINKDKSQYPSTFELSSPFGQIYIKSANPQISNQYPPEKVINYESSYQKPNQYNGNEIINNNNFENKGDGNLNYNKKQGGAITTVEPSNPQQNCNQLRNFDKESVNQLNNIQTSASSQINSAQNGGYNPENVASTPNPYPTKQQPYGWPANSGYYNQGGYQTNSAQNGSYYYRVDNGIPNSNPYDANGNQNPWQSSSENNEQDYTNTEFSTPSPTTTTDIYPITEGNQFDWQSNGAGDNVEYNTNQNELQNNVESIDTESPSSLPSTTPYDLSYVFDPQFDRTTTTTTTTNLPIDNNNEISTEASIRTTFVDDSSTPGYENNPNRYGSVQNGANFNTDSIKKTTYNYPYNGNNNQPNNNIYDNQNTQDLKDLTQNFIDSEKYGQTINRGNGQNNVNDYGYNNDGYKYYFDRKKRTEIPKKEPVYPKPISNGEDYDEKYESYSQENGDYKVNYGTDNIKTKHSDGQNNNNPFVPQPQPLKVDSEYSGNNFRYTGKNKGNDIYTMNDEDDQTDEITKDQWEALHAGYNTDNYKKQRQDETEAFNDDYNLDADSRRNQYNDRLSNNHNHFTPQKQHKKGSAYEEEINEYNTEEDSEKEKKLSEYYAKKSLYNKNNAYRNEKDPDYRNKRHLKLNVPRTITIHKKITIETNEDDDNILPEYDDFPSYSRRRGSYASQNRRHKFNDEDIGYDSEEIPPPSYGTRQPIQNEENIGPQGSDNFIKKGKNKLQNQYKQFQNQPTSSQIRKGIDDAIDYGNGLPQKLGDIYQRGGEEISKQYDKLQDQYFPSNIKNDINKATNYGNIPPQEPNNFYSNGDEEIYDQDSRYHKSATKKESTKKSTTKHITKRRVVEENPVDEDTENPPELSTELPFKND